MNLIPVTPGLLWLLEGPPNSLPPDPRDFIGDVPDNYDLLNELEQDLDRMGFKQDTTLKPAVWTLEIGPLKFHVYRVLQGRGTTYQMEVHVRGKMARLNTYEGGEFRQITGDVHGEIQTFKEVGLIEAVNPKDFLEQTPDMKEFLRHEYQSCAEHPVAATDKDYGYQIMLFVTASEGTIRGFIHSITRKAGLKPEDVQFQYSPVRSPHEPMLRNVLVVYRNLQ